MPLENTEANRVLASPRLLPPSPRVHAAVDSSSDSDPVSGSRPSEQNFSVVEVGTEKNVPNTYLLPDMARSSGSKSEGGQTLGELERKKKKKGLFASVLPRRKSGPSRTEISEFLHAT